MDDGPQDLSVLARRKDAKIAGVCSTLGAKFGIDPTFIRIAWVAVRC